MASSALPQQPAAAASNVYGTVPFYQIVELCPKEELWKVIFTVCVCALSCDLYLYLPATGTFGRATLIMSYQQYMNMGEFGGLSCYDLRGCWRLPGVGSSARGQWLPHISIR